MTMYYDFEGGDDADGALRVGGGLVEVVDRLSSAHPIRSRSRRTGEITIEKIICHDGTRGLATRFYAFRFGTNA